jgi:hypothetical protein
MRLKVPQRPALQTAPAILSNEKLSRPHKVDLASSRRGSTIEGGASGAGCGAFLGWNWAVVARDQYRAGSGLLGCVLPVPSLLRVVVLGFKRIPPAYYKDVVCRFSSLDNLHILPTQRQLQRNSVLQHFYIV